MVFKTVALDEIGLPGFIFLRDDIEYYSRTQHTNLKTTGGSRWILQIQPTSADYKSPSDTTDGSRWRIQILPSRLSKLVACVGFILSVGKSIKNRLTFALPKVSTGNANRLNLKHPPTAVGGIPG